MSLLTLRTAFSALVAIVFLNTALTFQAVWPTWWIRPSSALSVEIACLVLALALQVEWRGRFGPWPRRLVTIILLLLVLVHYGEVMTNSLFGRPLNLYWDIQPVPTVAALLVDAVPAWLLAAAVLSVIAGLACLATILAGVLRLLTFGLTEPAVRRSVAAVAMAGIGVFAAGQQPAWFATPVTALLAQQLGLAVAVVVAREVPSVGSGHSVSAANLDRLGGADVFVIFLESYGATVFQEPAHAEALAPDFAALDDALKTAGWQVASAFVDSPTFGGGSWLAHSSLLSGIRIAGEGDYRLLLGSQRQTLVQHFQAAGYRAVALMPGLKQAWPEGNFYHFDRLYDMAALDYRGPAIGWWAIPDQYSLDRLNRLELAAPGRAPLLVVFATIMSHMPFAPVAPYQPDWSRMVSTQPFDAAELAAALQQEPRWTDLGPPYLRSIRYDLKVLAGYLRERAPRNALFLVLGDHQPLASVSGPRASWSVPVHVITRNTDLLNAFITAGFRAGLRPSGPPLGGMHRLHWLLLAVLDSANPLSVHASGR